MNRENKLFLIDTSAWILGLKRNFSPQIKNILTEILDKDQSATTGIIILELLQGTKTKKEYEEIFSDLSALHYFEENKEIWKKASLLGFELRQKIVCPLFLLSLYLIFVNLLYVDTTGKPVGYSALRVNKRKI